MEIVHMIRDPSDGSIREKPDVETAAKSAAANRLPNQFNNLIPTSTSGLPLESTKDKAKLEKSRQFIRDYFNRNPEQGT